MTKVDFYLVNSDTHARTLCCELIAQQLTPYRRFYVRVSDESAALALDEWMWAYDESGFIPHALDNGDHASMPTPVRIGHHAHPKNASTHTLVTLTPTIPEHLPKHPHIITIVSVDPNTLQQARQHYRFYQQCACQLHYYDFRQTKAAVI